MKRDIRESPLYREAEYLHASLRRPGDGVISDAADPSTNGTHAVYTATLVDALDGFPSTRICLTDLSSGDTRIVTFGPNSDQQPKFSPDGKRIAFLSDRYKPGDFQLFLLDLETGDTRAAPPVDGWVEYIHWSPNGAKLLLGVAGHGADLAGAQGAITTQRIANNFPSWMPVIEAGRETFQWRRAWVYDVASKDVRAIGPDRRNVWEAAWCGLNAIAAVTSAEPGEGHWYKARLDLLDIDSGMAREVYAPRDQIGLLAGSPAGRYLAVVEGPCSDRGVLAGNLVIFDLVAGTMVRADTERVDITYTEWRSETTILLAGHREFESVVGTYSMSCGRFSQAWSSRDITTGGRYITVSGLDNAADCLLIGEGFNKAPELAVIRGGNYRVIRGFDHAYAEHCSVIGGVERFTWSAPDGLEIQGLVLAPGAAGPHPLVMYVHGGPVSHWRPRWLGRASVHILMLLKRGCAVFLPNPRGSSARGQHYARRVFGDMGGGDAQDLLAGLDALVQQRLADPRRLGVIGGSYGGFMTAWLVTQDSRFSAAVAVAPHTNQVSAHLCSNIPHFMTIITQDHYTNPTGKYFERSPIMHAHKVRTPTLVICGSLDRCTPPEEGLQFHNALREYDVESVLVRYPEEGHGIRKFPAVIDYAARIVSWFEYRLATQDV